MKLYTLAEVALSIQKAIGINLFLYDGESESFTVFNHTTIDIELLAKEDLLPEILDKCRQRSEQPEFIFNEMNCGWTVIYMSDENVFYVIGPFLLGGISEKKVNQYFVRRGFDDLKAKNASENYLRIPMK